jgi:anti-repressor protein
MSELNNLIPISYDNPERPTVSGRELHNFLNIETPYVKWFNRMTEYGFTEGEDYAEVLDKIVQNPKEGGRPATDHQLTIPMAKELCMIQRNERGKQARQYFLAVEAQWNSPEAVMRRAVLIAQKQNDQLKAANRQLLAENNDLKPDAEYARAVCVGKNCRTTTTLAKDYGLSAEKLNSILHGLKIQYKTSDGQWVLYAKYCGKGYTKNRKSTPFQHKSTGEWDTKNTTVWTEAGQRFIYEQLKVVGMLPSVERRQSVEQMELAARQHNQDGVKVFKEA